ncbi:TRAP transporter permease [Alkalicoccobacillus porphyridii]|uniref:TRAP transporter permease n=2 Tax=Alkalicoccobacillus porphyridii TaxID=2597270 RepID=A0A553ZV01_9BACI|nr:TRAP transporter permease [Alkalicoccobacillus porphyridii]
MESEKIDVDDLAKKFDSSSRFRVMKGKMGIFVAAIAVAMSVFHLLTAGVISMNSMQHRAVHLTFAIVLIFLLYPATKKSNKSAPSIVDYVLTALGAAGVGYLAVMFEDIARRGINTTTLDLVMGFITMVLVLEAARRSMGKQLPIIGLAFLLYAYLGPYLPGVLGHRGISIDILIERMYLGNEGIFGIALGVSATYVFLFVLFGAFLNGTGMSSLFTNGAIAVAGSRPGGPAKVSVLASGSLGMINGSAVANVATTGIFSIPLMQRVGYKKNFAASVEAVSSTGGQIMPPIMGAAAFVMAEFLGIPFTHIIVAAIIPALLYFVAVWFMVHFEAKKTGIQGIARDQLPDLKKILKQRGHLIAPIILLLIMLFNGFTPIYAAFFAIISTYLIAFIRKETRMSFKDLLHTLAEGAKGTVVIAIATAVVGFVIGVVNLTGIGLQLTNMILALAQGQLFLTLLLTMIACIIVGMGLPSTAAYIVAVVVAAPALINLGVAPIAAHMFVFYYACLSNITPPVAMASYTAAALANANPTQVSWTAVRLGLAGFIVPFFFIYSPSLLLQSNFSISIVITIVAAIVGIYALSTAVIGYWIEHMNLIERVLMFAASVVLIYSGLFTDAIGIVLIGLTFILQKRKQKNRVFKQPSHGQAM